jgi:hypothetical protein
VDLTDSVPNRFLAQLKKTGTADWHKRLCQHTRNARFLYQVSTKQRREVRANYRSNTLQRKGSGQNSTPAPVEKYVSTGITAALLIFCNNHG